MNLLIDFFSFNCSFTNWKKLKYISLKKVCTTIVFIIMRWAAYYMYIALYIVSFVWFVNNSCYMYININKY